MKRTTHFAATVVVAILANTLLGQVRAQDVDPAEPLPVAEQPTEPTGESDPKGNAKSLGGMIISGGSLNVIFFGILGVFSLWAATVVLERIVNLRRDKLLPGSFAKQLAQIFEQRNPDLERVHALCTGTPSPASRILNAGVIRAGRPLPEVEKAMEDAAAREMVTLRAKSRPLNVVGNIAPLVGLLGTVVGMIMAFQISSQEGLGKAELLAEGIYLALMTTAAGLTIAIPCLLFASWFQARGEKFMCDVSDCLTDTLPCFAEMEGKRIKIATAQGKSNDHDLSARERFLREGVVESANS